MPSSEEPRDGIEGDITVPIGDGNDRTNTSAKESGPTRDDPSGRFVRIDSEAGGLVDNTTGNSNGTGSSAPPQRTLQPPEFPSVFYDPLTQTIMAHPVVNPEGDSYEQSTVTSNGTSAATVIYYPNRALQAIIQKETTDSRTKTSVRHSIRRFDSALRSGWGRLVSNSVFPSNYKPLPETFYCPIMCELMVDPVIDPDGNTFEREAMEHWIRANGKSPVTRTTVTIAQLRPNNAMYALIQREKNRTSDAIHPSIRRWKDATDLTSRRPLQAAVAVATTLVPTNTNTVARPFPTTNSDLVRQRREHRAYMRTTILCYVGLCTFLVVILVFPIGIAFFGLLLAAVCCLASNAENNAATDG